MNGWQFRAAQKADSDLAAIPVVALTADGSAKAAAIDAAAYIRKPSSADALLSTIGRILLDDDRRQLLRRLAEAERFAPLGRLAASVGHEINNPLAAVSLNIDVLAAQVRRYFDEHAEALRALPAVPVMLNECRHGLNRVRDVIKSLQSSSLGAPPREAFSLNALIDDSLAMARIHVRERGTVRKEYGDVPPVVGDRSALRQVFLNLILNAAHALPEGRAEANEITLRTYAEGDRVTAEIHDSGPGISAETLLHIFDPFVPSNSGGEKPGLDLPVAFRIVADHGGRMEVDSEVGRGSTFRVVLNAAASA